MSALIQNPAPLQANYIPASFVDREDTLSALREFFTVTMESGSTDLIIRGPRGVGKTHLVRRQLHELDDSVATCYVPCTRFNTQYKVLSRIHEQLLRESAEEGHHTASLQRKLDKRIGGLPTIIVLDEIDLLLLNDGNDLLYFLSRIDDRESLSLVLISNGQASLEEWVEERTFSSLYPRTLTFEPYSSEEIFKILADRARKALAPRSLHKEALSHISSSTRNVGFALCWLQTAARNANETLSKPGVTDVYQEALDTYAGRLLSDFSQHHQLLYSAIVDLDEGADDGIRTGKIYQRYRKLCRIESIDSLSNRRLSDFLKELEMLDLIQADYYYGGEKGKTREIRLTE
ncbi:Cdc6/Cdc18 family protein [Haloplanus aerogenes]|uniref:AAA family ATPase n=1 Tax=Haloplanus aerogenes TaxID=660522 RepID=A0A3M0CZF3_9EURY|nr:AAA family ATPase [Haloplanus aerogenes]AZH26696.1 AAA family ATPase [Haloplanus aerogenes]RMB12936.1 orc1/cdc6 family replication initiation protein [Haloplanus aerogenes]